MPNEPKRPMEEVIAADGRYPPQAYEFLYEALKRAVKEAYGRDEPAAGEGEIVEQRHVTGQQLCLALRDLAVERWGMLARTVLERWNIRGSIDFGNMVYLLVENSFMRKIDEDSIEDFRDVFDFAKAFKVSADFDLKE